MLTVLVLFLEAETIKEKHAQILKLQKHSLAIVYRNQWLNKFP